MKVKEVVEIAKKNVLDLFNDEQIMNLGLEEVDFDEHNNEWRVTIGFSRPWDEPRNTFASLAQATLLRRSYKVVRIADLNGKVLSIRNHEI